MQAVVATTVECSECATVEVQNIVSHKSIITSVLAVVAATGSSTGHFKTTC